MKLRKSLAAVLIATVVPLAAACGATDDAASAATGTSSSTTSGTAVEESASQGPSGAGGGPGGVDVSSVSTEAELVDLVQEAYGDAGLDLHRGHQPVQDVLDEVLAISHDELHVRMDAGQNLATVAEDLGVEPQELVDALVESWSPAIDSVLATGGITEEEAEQYRTALEEAFTYRITWDGEAATPTFSGPAA